MIELHGNTQTIRCTNCGRIYPVEPFIETAASLTGPPPCPNCGGILKSGTVAFGEPMPQEALRTAFKDLKDRLTVIAKNPYERRSYLYLDIVSWLESKIEGIPVQEVIRQKFLHKVPRI